MSPVRKSFDRMSAEELCREGDRLRGILLEASEHLYAVYSTLSMQTRRQPVDGMTAAYITISNAGQRLAGVVMQGSRRMVNVDRILVSAHQAVQEEQDRVAEQKRKREAREAKAKAEKARETLHAQILSGEVTNVDSHTLLRAIAGAKPVLSNDDSDDLDDLFGNEDGS